MSQKRKTGLIVAVTTAFLLVAAAVVLFAVILPKQRAKREWQQQVQAYRADKIAQYEQENAAYADIGIRWIEESLEPELAGRYDYYNVPSLFYEGRKLYEAKPFHNYDTIKDSIRKAFDTVVAQ